MTKARDLANASTALSAVDATELGYLDGVTSAVQTQLDAKQPTVANVSDTEIGYLDGVTSAIQTQLDAKVSTAGGSVIAANSSGNALEIRQTGAGNALVVEDDTNPDATSFVIDAAGNVGIGVTPNTRQLTVFQDSTPVVQLTNTASGTTASDGSLVYLAGSQLSFRAAETDGSISLQTGGANGRMLIASTGETTVINTVTNTPAVRNIYMSTSDPSGGSDGDVWIKYTA